MALPPKKHAEPDKFRFGILWPYQAKPPDPTPEALSPKLPSTKGPKIVKPYTLQAQDISGSDVAGPRGSKIAPWPQDEGSFEGFS